MDAGAVGEHCTCLCRLRGEKTVVKGLHEAIIGVLGLVQRYELRKSFVKPRELVEAGYEVLLVLYYCYIPADKSMSPA